MHWMFFVDAGMCLFMLMQMDLNWCICWLLPIAGMVADSGWMTQSIYLTLDTWGLNVSEVNNFAAFWSLPWSFKPFYGVLTDFFPIMGYRRKSWLVISGVVGRSRWLPMFSVSLQHKNHLIKFESCPSLLLLVVLLLLFPLFFFPLLSFTLSL